MKVYTVKPYGVCFGVNKAVDIAIKLRYEHPKENITVLGMLVHNENVVKELEKHNILSLFSSNKSDEELINEINDGYIIFTAHGHKKNLEVLAQNKGLKIVDATCSQVQKVIDLIKSNKECNIIYIGKENHPETNACLSYGNHIYRIDSIDDVLKLPDIINPLVINQTTYSLLDLKDIHDQLKKKFENIEFVDEICSTTRIRQEAILKMPEDIDLVYIVGDEKSSNTQRLVELSKNHLPNAVVKKIATVKHINNSDLKKANYVGIASGASTPLSITNEVIKYITNFEK
ncbi:MAG: 4-hydroxy-3-methylbut-2-enyl diphosphate reductase [Bacilli bacterium]